MMSDGTGPIGHPRSRRSHDDDQAGFRNLLHIHSYIKLNQEDDPVPNIPDSFPAASGCPDGIRAVRPGMKQYYETGKQLSYF
jgi:hypothetical protein